MSKDIQKVLITGCSYSAPNTQSGWKEPNLYNTYHHMLQAKRHWQIDNRAIGGCSNREIMLRTVENCLSKHYDLCIVQWSSLHRLWLYEDNLNVDDETQILPSVCGRLTVGDAPTEIQKIIVSHYLNNYIALKHWLQDQVMLQEFFKQRGLCYIFVRGFHNYVPELEILTQQWPNASIPSLQIPDSIKTILHFDANPDDYLHRKLSRLLEAYLAIDKSHCLGYNQSSMIYGFDAAFNRDYADDGRHPGRAVNTALCTAILDHFDQMQDHGLDTRCPSKKITAAT